MSEQYIEGRNPVMEAINGGREIDKILVAKGSKEGSIKKIVGLAKDQKIVVQEVERAKLDELSETGRHQGIVAFVAAQNYVEVEDILEIAARKGEPPFIIVAENITDPHNLGAIIRTANAAGAHGVIIPKRRSVGLTATVAKSSAGAVEYVPVAKVTNIVRTLEDLKKQNIWVVAADMDGEVYFNSNLTGAMALVVGSEGEGISRLVKQTCDFVVSMPMFGKITSLNASVAASLLMYEIVRQRKFK